MLEFCIKWFETRMKDLILSKKWKESDFKELQQVLNEKGYGFHSLGELSSLAIYWAKRSW